MAKKQLKKLNQPKKYLQGGSNMSSVSMMRQNPYYLGQVEQKTAEEKVAETQQQAMDVRQNAIQAKAESEAQQKEAVNQSLQQGVGTLGQAAVADKKAGILGKLWIPAATTAAPATVVNTGLVNPSTGQALTATLGKTTGGAQGVNFSNLVSQQGAGVVGQGAGTTAAGTTAAGTTAGSAGSAAAGGMSGLTSGLIGVAATIGGQVIKKKSNDNSAYTFTDAERRGNVAGSMISSAGTGFGIGNAIVPGIGGVIGGFAGATVGAIKARKENKAAEEEAKRLGREQDAIAGANQSARINSMLTGIDTGFGLNSSFNSNTKATNYYQVAQTGGIRRYATGGTTDCPPGTVFNPTTGNCDPVGNSNSTAIAPPKIDWSNPGAALSLNGVAAPMAAPSNASTKQYSVGNKVLNVTTQDPTLQAGYEAPVGNAMTNTDQTSLAEAGKFLGNAIRGNKKYDLNTVYEQFRTDNAGQTLTSQQINDFIQANGLKFQDFQKLDTKWRTSAQKDAIQNPNAGGPGMQKGSMGGDDCYGGTCHPGGDIRVNPTWTKRLGGITGIQEDRRLKRVPGGIIVPIEGTDAVEFKGRSHKQGGIIIDKDAKGEPTVEVENDEVMLPLKMKDGKKQDYIFSDYLKIGGKSFAQRSKEILKGAGSQANLQQLATMQEKMAGRNSETVSVAKYGGIPQYATGGVPANDCPTGTIYNAATKKCEPFSFNSIANMVTGKTPINVANNTTDPATNSKPAVPIAISKPKKDRPLEEKYEGWKYVYDIAKSLGDPFPELTASQWAQESGWGESLTGRNNPFGQTTKDRSKGTSLGTPRDPGPKGQTKIFINYDNYEQAILDHLKKWKLPGNSKNTGVENAKDAREAVYLIQRHGENDRYAEGYDNNWEGYVENTMKIADAQSKRFGVYRESTYVPDKTKYPKAKGVGSTTSVKETPKKLPPPPVSGDVVPPTFAQRNALPGIGAMQMNEEIQMPEQPKSNVAFDPTGPDNVNGEPGPIRFITADKDQAVRPDGIRLFQDKKTKEYIYRDGNNNEIIRGTDRNALENQIAALQPGFSGFDAQLLEAEAPVQRQDLTGVKPNFAAVTPTNGQTAANNQTVIAQQNGTTNAPASESSWIDEMWANQNATAYNAPAGVSPTATNGGPGTAPTINNQNSTFQYTAQTPGYLDYNDPNTAGGIFSGDRYEKDWKPLVGSTMADAAKADQVINYLTNYTGTDAEDVKAKLKGKNRAEQIAAINDLATDTKVGPFHNAVFGAMQQVNSGGGDVATNNPPVIPPVVPPSTTSGTTATTKRYTACPPGTYLSTDGTCKENPVYSKPYDGNIVAAIGAGAQLIPPIYAALKPYQKVGPIAGAPSVKGAILGRDNMNQERTTSREMNTAINQEVTNNNTGAAGFAIRQAAMAAANKQMLEIANAESKANIDLRGKEAVLGQDASKYNADNSMKGQMFNADLEQKQNQYVDERNLGVVDAAAARLAGMANTYNQYKATDHLARVTNANTHSLERDKMYESLLKDSQNKNSQFNGASDAELRRIAAGLVEEQMGGVGRTGGVRQYISRLGELKSARATKAKL